MRPSTTDQPATRVSLFIAATSALTASMIWAFMLVSQQFRPFSYWLQDWHVYSAGARDFLNHDLYYAPLVSQFPLPVDHFNYPPLSAIAVMPLLPLPDSLGGTIWVIANLAAVAATGVLVARILGARQPAMWGALAFLAYTVHPWMDLAFNGNNTPLVLCLIAAFAHEHLRGHRRSAGLLLGAAIALKLWPAALIPLLLRERRWESLLSAALVVAGTALVSTIWLGLGVIGPALEAMQARGVVDPWNPVLYISWLRETLPWWPSWAGYVVAVFLFLIPARGKLGIGLGIFAGLAVVPNVWRTYAPTVEVAGRFVVSDVLHSRWQLTRMRTNADDVVPAGSATSVDGRVDEA
jgi:hypothetical protein